MSLLSRLRSVWRRQLDADIREELDSHIAMRADDNQRSGMRADEARDAARRRFGNATRIQEATRKVDLVNWLEMLGRNFRFAFRMWRRNPGFTAVAVATIALGIGANAAIFSVMEAVILHVVPYPHPETIVAVIEHTQHIGDISGAWPDFVDWQKQNDVFGSMAAYQSSGLNLTGAGEPLRLNAMRVSASFFAITGYRPTSGRIFSTADDAVGANPTVLLAHRLWAEHFGGDPALIGKTIKLNAENYTVIGILPADFWIRQPVDVVVPISLAASDPDWQDRFEHPGIRVMARLKPGVTLAQAGTEMAIIAKRLEEEYPNTNAGETALVRSFGDVVVGDDLHATMRVLMAAVAFVLLIACANVANLLLARSSARQKEMAVRAALGAGRKRLAVQALTESGVLSLAGGAMGLGIAVAAMPAMLRFVPPDVQGLQNVHLDWTVLGFVAALSISAAVLFGAIPALQTSHVDLIDAMKQAGRNATAGRSGKSGRNALLIGEVAFATLLAAGAGLMVRSMIRVEKTPLGFEPQDLLTLNVSLPVNQYPRAEGETRYFTSAIERLAAIPGILSAAVVRCLPMAGACWDSSYVLSDRPIPAQNDLLEFNTNVVSTAYFDTMKVPVLTGRAFTERDDSHSPLVAIVNETLARRMWPNGNPIGVRIKQGRPDDANPYREIIGVVGDVKREGMDATQVAEVFMPIAQKPGPNYSFVIRTAGSPMNIAGAAERAIHMVDKDQPVTDVQPMEQYLGDSLARRRLSTLLLTIFGGLALVLAAIGIYGVMSYTVSLRTQEMGIRLALGAQPGALFRLIVAGGAGMAVVGLLTGLAASLGLARFLQTLLYGTRASDPLTLLCVSFVLLGIAGLASYVPARRASRVDPIVTLRSE